MTGAERYFVRPGHPEGVHWTYCPEDVARALKERGLTETDREAYEIHRKVHAGREGRRAPREDRR